MKSVCACSVIYFFKTSLKKKRYFLKKKNITIRLSYGNVLYTHIHISNLTRIEFQDIVKQGYSETAVIDAEKRTFGSDNRESRDAKTTRVADPENSISARGLRNIARSNLIFLLSLGADKEERLVHFDHARKQTARVLDTGRFQASEWTLQISP